MKDKTCGECSAEAPEHTCSSCKRFGYAMGEPQCFGNWYSSNTSDDAIACKKFKQKEK